MSRHLFCMNTSRYRRANGVLATGETASGRGSPEEPSAGGLGERDHRGVPETGARRRWHRSARGSRPFCRGCERRPAMPFRARSPTAPQKTPTPFCPKALSNALSSNSPAIAGRMPWVSNQASSERRSEVSSVGSTEGSAVEVLREAALEACGDGSRGEERDPALPEQVVEHTKSERGGSRSIGKNEVQLVNG